MRHILIIALAVILTLSLVACGDNNSAKLPAVVGGDTSMLGTDFQKHMNQSTSSLMNSMCETDSGYYFQYDAKIYYIEKERGTSTILCGKPDCSHAGDTCNAFVNSNSLTYYDGKLYWSHNDYEQENGSVVNKGERLHSTDLDGTNQSIVQLMDFIPGGDTNNYVTKPIIHRGQLYFCYSGELYVAGVGSDIEDAILLYGETLIDNGSMIFNPNELYYELWADGELMYFMAKNVRQSDGTYKDTLFCYDPQKEKVQQVWAVPDKSEVGAWNTTGVSVSQWYVSGGYIYFYLSGNDVWYTELDTGKTNKLIDLDLSAGAASFSDKYIVIMNKTAHGYDLIGGGAAMSAGDTLYVYGYDGKLVKEISLDKIYDDCDKVSECDILWIDDGVIYVHADATIIGVNNAPTTQQHFIYTANIASGSLDKTDWIGD